MGKRFISPSLAKTAFQALISSFLLTVFSFESFAADLPALIRQFEVEYFTHYQSGKCGQNILSFLDRAKANRLDLEGAQIIRIEDKNAAWFGMVNAERARQSGRRIPSSPNSAPLFEEGERNWYHHVILEADGYVVDFDFTNEPKVLPTVPYFEEMFLDESSNPPKGALTVGRQNKLDGYELTLTPAEDYLVGRDDSQVRKLKVRLCRFLSVPCSK